MRVTRLLKACAVAALLTVGLTAPPAGAAEPGSISGTVTSSLGGPLEGVSVCAGGEADPFDYGCDTSAADGTYSIGDLEPGAYDVYFYGEGVNHLAEYYDDAFNYSEHTVVTVADAADTAGIDAELAALGSLSGVVTSSAGGALAGVTVCASGEAAPYDYGCGTSGADGGYTIIGLAAGSYSIQFDAFGTNHAGEYYDDAVDYADRALVELAAGADVSGIDAELLDLPDPGSISGTVTTAGGTPIEGVSVCANGSISNCGSTDPDGDYVIDGLTPDLYTVFFDGTSSGFASEYYDNAASLDDATSVQVLEAIDTPDIDAVLVVGGAVIETGRTTLGLNKEGDLNFFNTGLAFDGNDGIYPGCLCEGWGAGDAATQVSGKAGRVFGVDNVEVESFSATEDSAVSVVIVDDGAGDPALRVTHDYHPSDAADVFEVSVTIENLSDEVVDPVYRRAMDWDIPPTEFNEYVTIQGTTNADNVLFASDDGFADGDPFAGPSQVSFVGDAVDNGPADHGALFDFGFDAIDPGETTEFDIYYGAKASEADANAALADIDAEIYSYGQPSSPDGSTLGVPNTFIFAFAGVGGQVQFPDVSGTVTGPDGQPLENVWVFAYSDTDVFAPTAIVLTAADGTYAFGSLPAGTYRLGFIPVGRTGIAGEWYDASLTRTGGTPVVVNAAHDPVSGIDASLTALASLSGTVTGPGGTPVGSVRVALFTQEDGLYSFRTTDTAADGTYSFPGLAPGSYTVVFRAHQSTGLVSEWYEDVPTRSAATPIVLSASEAETLDVGLVARP